MGLRRWLGLASVLYVTPLAAYCAGDCLEVYSQECCPITHCPDEPLENWLRIGTGYRCDKLHWNIAGPHGCPNVFSELKWDNLQIAQGTFEAKGTLPCLIYGRASTNYGGIFEGRVVDSDYAGNHRTLLFSRSHSKANKGWVWDISACIGYPLLRCPGSFHFSPIAGYSHHEQHVRILGGNLMTNAKLLAQLFQDNQCSSSSSSSSEGSSQSSASGSGSGSGASAGGSTGSTSFSPSNKGVSGWQSHSLPDVDSSYTARWTGPWVGFDFDWTVATYWDLFCSAEFHWTRYSGRGHWNARPDLADDFRQNSHAFGWIVNGGVRWNFSCHWSVTLMGNYQDWRTGKGSDRTYYYSHVTPSGSYGGQVKQAHLRLNHVTWQSYSTGLLIAYRF